MDENQIRYRLALIKERGHKNEGRSHSNNHKSDIIKGQKL
jgi:hypothetical protein